MKHVKIKNEIKGITLIALVITIIVLLVLAGVTIAMLTGDNGILMQAKVAKEKDKIAKIEEEVKLHYEDAIMKEKLDENINKVLILGLFIFISTIVIVILVN